MNTVLVALTLLLTIVLSLGLGVVLGYLFITSLLRALGRRPQAPARPAIVAGEAHGGD